MDSVYLAVSVNNVLYTLNAYRPVKQNPVLFVPSFFASWITIELAWIHLVWQVALTAVVAAKGGLRTRRGRLGLLLNVANWAALGLMVWRSLGARDEIKSAFADLESPERELRRHGVKRTRNIVFNRVAGKTLRLDIYEPGPNNPHVVTPGAKRPAILQIHGGGWVVGDKREQGLPLLRYLAAEGWVGFNANYRLSPGATFPDHLVDIKRAIEWIRAHADEYDVDPDFIAVTGGSAGGHLAALAALTGNDPAFQPGFEGADTSIQAAVPFYAVYDFTNRKGYYPADVVPKFMGPWIIKADIEEEPEKFAAASPLDQITAEAPPFLVIHGDNDTLAPVEGARDFVDELRRESKAPVLYLELKGAQHAFEIFPSIRANHVVRAVARFLDTVHAEYEEGLAPEQMHEDQIAQAVDAVTPASEAVTAS